MQSLIKTATATWTEPAAPEDRRRLAVLRELESAAGEEADPAAEEQIARIREEIGTAEQIRITVKTATVLAMAQHKRRIREAVDYLRETMEDSDPEFWILYGALRVWAAAAVTFAGMEARTVPRWKMDGAKWKKTDPPAWLDDPALFLETMPELMVGALDEAIEAANPGIFVVGQVDDETKKNGGASASA